MEGPTVDIALEWVVHQRASHGVARPLANLTLGRWGVHQWTTAGVAGPPLCLPSTSWSASGPHPGMVEGTIWCLQEWLVHKRTLPGALGPRVGPPSGGADTSGPPLEWLADQCTSNGVAGHPEDLTIGLVEGTPCSPTGLLTIEEYP